MADPALEEQVAGLIQGAETGAVQVQVLAPDDACVAAMGINPLDPAVRAPAARAGSRRDRRPRPGSPFSGSSSGRRSPTGALVEPAAAPILGHRMMASAERRGRGTCPGPGWVR